MTTHVSTIGLSTADQLLLLTMDAGGRFRTAMRWLIDPDPRRSNYALATLRQIGAPAPKSMLREYVLQR